jgi:ABC-2 type transport system ATP-binding protein
VLELILEEKAKGRTIFLSSHILSDVERTCDEVFMIRQGEIVHSEPLSALVGQSQQWEIEVLSWKKTVKEELSGFHLTFLEESDERAVLLCAVEQKRDLLHRLTELPVEVGTVQRRRGASLEDVYMKYVGRG